MARDLLVDSFTRVRELVVELTDGLTEEAATYRPGPKANSISWLLWHLTRIQDDHVAALAAGGAGVAELAGAVRPAVQRLGDRLRPEQRAGGRGTGRR